MVFLSLLLIPFLLLFLFSFLILDFYFLYLLVYSSLQICRISLPPTCWVFIRIFPSILISNKPNLFHAVIFPVALISFSFVVTFTKFQMPSFPPIYVSLYIKSPRFLFFTLCWFPFALYSTGKTLSMAEIQGPRLGNQRMYLFIFFSC